MGERVKAPKGMKDVLPGAADRFLDTAVWERIFAATARIFGGAGYRRVWLPAVEQTQLFARGIGTETDIVAKEMFSFEDRGGRHLTLRPEGTAGAARAYVEHNYAQGRGNQRWWYAGPMFRAEAPQEGRYRQFFQVGAELFGAGEPLADAELLALLWRWCGELGLTGLRVAVNTLGDDESRAQYREALQAYLRAHAEALCEDSRRRIETNPLRVLDCKRDACRRVAAGAPDIMDSLSGPSRAHFAKVRDLLGELGVPYERDRHLVRGLDYYTGTIFEFTTSAIGAQNAVLGGGRYDGLIEQLGGPPTPAIGFSAGVERTAMLLAQEAAGREGPDLYLIPMERSEVGALQLADALRRLGRRVEVDVGGGRLKHQFKRADRSGARAALVLGEDEVRSNEGRLKDLAKSEEVGVQLNAEALHAALAQLDGGQETT
jgi:histidyl-tRNA synthetase